MAFTSENLIESVKNKALIPISQITFTDEQILQIANEEIQTAIVPMLLDAREDYMVKYQEQGIVNGQDEYVIPARAIGGKLKDLTIFDSVAIAETRRDNERSIAYLPSELVPYRTSSYATYDYQAFFFRGNNVVLHPKPSTDNAVLRLYYFERPNRLVKQTDAGRIDSIDTTNNQVTLGNLPIDFSINTLVDFVKATPGFENRATDQTIQNINGLTLTFTELPTGLVVGDYVCLAEETPVVQLPVELHPILAQRVTVKILEAIGDTVGSNLARVKLQEMEINATGLLQPRIEGETKKIINPFSPLNVIGRSNRWNGY